MKRLWSVTLAILVALGTQVAPLASRATPADAAACRFVLGFQVVHDALPDIVGDCRSNEHYNPENGDALQETANGLMVWRKADNFTAFTDGYRSWVNGPFGIQKRLNTERFDWEPVDPQAIAINLNDLPTGFAALPEYSGYTYNEQLIKQAKDPAGEASYIKKMGRVQGYTSTFQNWSKTGVEGSIQVSSFVLVCQTAEGAHIAYQDSLPTDTSVSTVSAPKIGDESVAFNSIVQGKDKDKTMWNAYTIIFRKGNILSFVYTEGVLGKASVEDTVKYARVVEARIK